MGVGEVDAGDEQDAENGSHEEPETGGGFADDDFFHRLDVGGEGSVGIAVKLVRRDLTGEVVVEGVEVFLGLRDGDAGFQAGERDVVAIVAVETEVVEVDGERRENLVVWKLTGEGLRGEFVGFGEVEVFGEDADDLIGSSGDLDGSAGDVGVGVVEGLPEMPGEDGDFFAAAGGLFGEEVAAEDGLDAEDVKEVGKSGDAADETRVVVGEDRPPVEPCWRMVRSSKVVECLRHWSKWRGLAPVYGKSFSRKRTRSQMTTRRPLSR